MVMPEVGYLYPFFFCDKILIEKMDDFTRALFLQEFGDSPSNHLVAFRLSPRFFEVLDLSPRPEWIVYVVRGVDDPIPRGYKNAPKLFEYVWSVGVSPPDYVSTHYKLLETDKPDKSLCAVGTIFHDYTIDWRYFAHHADADNYFWSRMVENNNCENNNCGCIHINQERGGVVS